MIDLRRVLSFPFVYRAFQALVGAHRLREILASEYIQPASGMRVLDIGCGTADILNHLGDVRYVGLDPSALYVETARRRFPGAELHVWSAGDEIDVDTGFDRVLAIGVLHHLNDLQAADLVRLATRALAPEGRLVTIDPTFVNADDSKIADAIVARDRGQWVRPLRGYAALVEGNSQLMIHPELRRDLLHIPYSHCILVGTFGIKNFDDENREVSPSKWSH